jgi:hypothetical protein
MTDEVMPLRGLMEKSADSDLLREMIGFAAERLMELEVGGLTVAAHGEKSTERMVQHNGYRDRDWQTRADTVELPRRDHAWRRDENVSNARACARAEPAALGPPERPAPMRPRWIFTTLNSRLGSDHASVALGRLEVRTGS